jgi:6-phosphogluconolactonase
MKTLKIVPNPGAYGLFSELWFEGIINQCLRENEVCNVALSGGTTPRSIYHKIGHRSVVEWGRVNIFVVDERWVPFDDERSNSKLISECFPEANVFTVDTTLQSPSVSASRYADVISEHVTNMSFDILSLGIGTDGHTASLFPGTPALDSTDWVTDSHGDGLDRVTFTFPLINRAKDILMIAGPEKANIVNDLINNNADVPAQRVERCKIIHYIAS